MGKLKDKPDPLEFDLSLRNPETYIILAVKDLIGNISGSALHTKGEPTAEYLGMISLYAIRRAYFFYGKGSPYAQMIKRAYDTFDPDHMSEKLKRSLLNLLMESSENNPSEALEEDGLSIRLLHLSDSLTNRLRQAGIHSIPKLLKLSSEQFRELRSLGEAAADEIAEALERNGYKTRAFELAFPGCTLKEIDLARKNPNSVLSLPLQHHLGNRLYRNGIKTVDQLKGLSVDELAELKEITYNDILLLSSVLENGS